MSAAPAAGPATKAASRPTATSPWARVSPPDPQRSRGETGGSRDARSYGKACVGTIDTTPDHRLTVTSALNLRIFVESTTDSTLVVVGPNRTWCDDDSHGDLDAEVSGVFAPGQYQIFVGTNGNQNGNYTITLTEQ